MQNIFLPFLSCLEFLCAKKDVLVVAEAVILQPWDDEPINKSPCTGDKQGEDRKLPMITPNCCIWYAFLQEVMKSFLVFGCSVTGTWSISNVRDNDSYFLELLGELNDILYVLFLAYYRHSLPRSSLYIVWSLTQALRKPPWKRVTCWQWHLQDSWWPLEILRGQ